MAGRATAGGQSPGRGSNGRVGLAAKVLREKRQAVRETPCCAAMTALVEFKMRALPINSCGLYLLPERDRRKVEAVFVITASVDPDRPCGPERLPVRLRERNRVVCQPPFPHVRDDLTGL